MIRKVLFFIYILISVLVLSSSCNREECKELEDMPIEFTRNWLFGVGTWWVYVSSDTLQLNDTATVSKVDIRGQTNDRSDPAYCQRLKIELIEHSNSALFNDNSIIIYPTALGELSYQLSFRSANWNTQSNGYVLSYPITPESVIGNWETIGNTSVTLYNHTFNNVWHLKSVSDNTQLFLAQDVGLVKYIRDDGTEWYLKDYSIQ